MSIKEIIEQLAELGVVLPLRRHSEDMATVVDASGSAVFVVDVNGERDDDDVIEIVGCLIDLFNIAGVPAPIEEREG